MIELELPELAFEELTLVNVDPVRGEPPADAEREPLLGRVKVGGPHLRKLTAERLAADPDVCAFVDLDQYEYYLVFLAVSFIEHGSPKLKSAQVKLALSAIPDVPVPAALSMLPRTEGDQVSVQRTVRLGPKLKLLDAVDAEAGSYERETSFQRSELVVRAVGLAGDTPGWEFTRTASRRLEGSCLLTMTVQVGHGAAVSVSGEVKAQATGNIRWHYWGDLPEPLRFTGAI